MRHSDARPLVRALYGLAGGLLLLGLLLGQPEQKNVRRIPLPLRMASSALVLICALLLWRNTNQAEQRNRAATIAAGMGCGFLGDLIMGRVIPLPNHVAFGMLTFGVGHMHYIRAFLRIARGVETRNRWTRPPIVGAAWSVGLIGWWLLVRAPTLGPILNYGALLYGLLLSSMAGIGADLATRDARFAPLALGGTLFLASDTILASQLFRQTHFPQIGDVVWLTYIGGQALIVGTAGEAW